MRHLKIASVVALLAGTAGLAIACGGDDQTDTPTPGVDAGTKDSSTGTPDTGTTPPKADSGSPADAGTPDTGPGTTTTLFQRLGGHDGAYYAVQAAVGNILEDPTEATYFHVFDLPDGGGADPNHRPTGPEIVECFTRLIGANAGGVYPDGGPYVYPDTFTQPGVDGGNADGSYTCRDMVTTHAKLFIPGPVFDNFVTIVAQTLIDAEGATATLTDGGAPFTYTYTSADIAALGGVLVSTKSAIVDAGAPDAYVCHDGTFCTDAGADAGPH